MAQVRNPTVAWAKAFTGVSLRMARELSGLIDVTRDGGVLTAQKLWRIAGLDPIDNYASLGIHPWEVAQDKSLNLTLAGCCMVIGSKFGRCLRPKDNFSCHEYAKLLNKEQRQNDAGELAGQAAVELSRLLRMKRGGLVSNNMS